MIFLSLFITFFKIGLFTFGGGYAMIPLIFEEVQAHSWLSSEELINFVAVAESTPGPFAINIATYIGTVTAGMGFYGILGSICATLGVVLPSFIIILIISHFYKKFKENKYVAGAFTGLKPCVVGLVGYAAINIGKTVFFPTGLVFNIETAICLGIFAIMTVLSFKKVQPIIIIVASAVLGIISGYVFL